MPGGEVSAYWMALYRTHSWQASQRGTSS